MATLGTVFDKNTAMDYLRESNRTDAGRKVWESAVGSAIAQEQQALGEAGYDYNAAMNEAYAASLAQKNAIAGQNIFGSTDVYDQQIDVALEEAYQQYYNNYLQRAQSAVTAANKQIGEVESELSQRGAYLAQLNDSMYDYLQYVYDNSPDLFENPTDWGRYLVQDESGMNRLMNQNEFIGKVFSRNLDGTYSPSDFGKDAYDQLLNDLVSRTGYENYSYDEWMQTEEAQKKYGKAYEWAQEYNPYAYGEFAEQNIGELRKMVGLAANDYTWSYTEHYTGKKKEELEAEVSERVAKLEKFVSKDKSVKKTEKAAIEALNELEDLAKEWSLHDAVDWDTVRAEVEKQASINQDVEEGSMTEYVNSLPEWIAKTLTFIGFTAVAQSAEDLVRSPDEAEAARTNIERAVNSVVEILSKKLENKDEDIAFSYNDYAAELKEKNKEEEQTKQAEKKAKKQARKEKRQAWRDANRAALQRTFEEVQTEAAKLLSSMRLPGSVS